jgi:hypothetical protein
MSNKQQLLKDFVSQQIQNSKQQTQPIVNSNGFKNGQPPAGSNWRIPGDTLYNPTPYPIQAVSDNGITKTLNPFDESTVEFPGAKYVDEYQMRFGGLKKFLPGGFSIEPEPRPGPKPTPVKPDYSYMQTIYDKYATDYPMLKIGDLVPTRSRSAQSVDELKGNMMSTGTISLYGLEDLPPEIATKIVAEIDAENLKRNPKYTTKERGRGKTDMWTDPRLVKSYNKVFDNVYINADGQIAMPFKTQQPVFQDLPKPVEEVVAPTVIKPAEETQTYQKTQPVYRMNYGQHKGQVQIGEDIWDDTSKKWKRVMFTPEQIQSSLEKGAIQKKDGGLNNYQNAGLVATSPYERIPQSWKEKYDWTPNVEEEYIRFKNDPNAPDNLRFTDDLNDYNVRGMWDSLERPVSWEQALTLYKDLNGEEWVPEEDGYYHAWSQHPGTGEWLKPKHHSTAWMNFAGYPMDPYSRVVVNPEGFFGDETLQTEYKQKGGLKKYQGLTGSSVVSEDLASNKIEIPKDAGRYGINSSEKLNTQYVNPDLVNRLEYTQGEINKGHHEMLAGLHDSELLTKNINYVDAYDNPDILRSGYIPQHIFDASKRAGKPVWGCISGVCRTLNINSSEPLLTDESGKAVKYYSNSAIQDSVKAGKLPGWNLDFDTKNLIKQPENVKIVQFLDKNKMPHHAVVQIPGTQKDLGNNFVSFDAYTNNGSGSMYRKSYTVNTKTDQEVYTGDNIQLITKTPKDFISKSVNTRDWLKSKIEEEDPQFFKKGKQARRWATYSPGFFNEKGKTFVTMDGEPLGYSTPTMKNNTDPDVQRAANLLTYHTLSNDVDYNALSKTAGFNKILNKVNDEQFKLDFMKRYNITNREYNAIVSNTFGIYGQESGFGTKPGGLEETDAVRKIDSIAGDIASRFKGKGSYKKNVKEDYSRGLLQVKLSNINNKDRIKYGIDADSLDKDPEKAFTAAMIVNAQNLPQLRKLAAKGETSAIDESNYLDFMPYLYSMPGRLKRGDKKTIQAAIDKGDNPDEMIIKDPNSPFANNEYINNVRAYANLFEHKPTTSTLEIKKDGGLTKYQIAGRTFEELMMEGLRPQSAASDNTYYTNARIEEAKRDAAEGVTPQQKQKAAVAKKKIAAEEKRQQLVAELANQGEIKPAPSEFDGNIAKAYYMVSNPMSALGHYARYGYIPQGNVGNYGLRYDQSPMEMIANSVNPFVWGNAAYRFTNDLADKNTYTTLGGAGNALFDALEATPMLGVMKSGTPSMLQDVSLAKSLANNKINQGISYLESKEGIFGRSPKLTSIPESKTLGASEMSRLADIESGMALQSSRLDPYQKIKKKIEFLESKPNLSEDDVVRMFGRSRKELYDELDVMEFNGGRPIEMTPPGSGRVSGINLERPARSQASRDAQAVRRANRQQNVQVRELSNIFQENPETFQQVLNDLPAYQRRNIQLDTSTEGLPRITIADANSLDMEAIRNLMNTVVQKPTITRATDAVKGLFNSNPTYKGEVQKFMPSFHATDYATPRQMLMDVKSKLDQGLTGLRVGDVGTGSTNTSHNSYLNQMDFIAQNAGKQGLSKPVFLGYEAMNPMGYLSNAHIPDDEIFRYINTKLNQIQQKRGVNFNLGQNAPYINEAGNIMIPQYGVRKLDNSFTQIKKQEGGSVLKSFVMSQLQAKPESSDNFDFEDSLSKFVSGGQHGGLDRWFAEKWVDVKSGKPCGRQEGEKRGYPACRPSKRVSEDTPKTSSEMSPSEKAKFKRTKTSSKRIPYNHKRN